MTASRRIYPGGWHACTLRCGGFSAAPRGDPLAEEELTMTANPAPPTFKVGDMVRIPTYNNRRAKIVEWWGPLGPGGVQAYRVIVRRKPSRVYIDLTEDQIVPIPPKE